VDLKKFSKLVGEDVRLAKPDEVLAATGYPVVNTGLRNRCSMVKLSKTRFWDVFSTFAYILAFLITMVAVVGLAIFVMMQPQLLGLA
jgi:hypothetical protein